MIFSHPSKSLETWPICGEKKKEMDHNLIVKRYEGKLITGNTILDAIEQSGAYIFLYKFPWEQNLKVSTSE